MKLDDFTVAVAFRVFELLEKKHLFKVPEQIRQKVIEEVRGETSSLIDKLPGKKV